MDTKRYEGHTKGLWRIGDNKRSPVGIFSGDDSTSTLARVYVTDPTNHKRTPEFEANARLIADAPALLEENGRLRKALRETIEDLKSAEVHVWGDEHPASPDDCRYCCTRMRAEAVLAEAERKQP